MKQITPLQPDGSLLPQIIRKSNDLIEARYRLSVEEQRIVLLLASQLSSHDDEFHEYELHVADYAHLFGLETNGKLYNRLEQAAEGLLGRVISLKTDSDDKVSKTVWFSYVEYTKGSGKIRLRFDKSLKPYLLQLKQHFTQYPLSHVANFKSQYSIRLYELLRMTAYKARDNQFTRTLTITDYREMLGINANEYLLFSDLRKRAIEPAVHEISSQTDLHISAVKYTKSGRKVVGVTFHITICSDMEMQEQLRLKEQQQLVENTSGLHRVVKELIDLGFAMETAKKFKNKYGVRRIERNISYTLAKKQEGLVKHIPAYLNKAITEDLGSALDVLLQKRAQQQKAQEKCAATLEAKADQAHMEKLAEMGDVPLESLLKGKSEA